MHPQESQKGGEVMPKFTVHGSFEDPKKAKSYARFSSLLDYPTREGAQDLLDLWKSERDYKFLWIEEAN